MQTWIKPIMYGSTPWPLASMVSNAHHDYRQSRSVVPTPKPTPCSLLARDFSHLRLCSCCMLHDIERSIA